MTRWSVCSRTRTCQVTTCIRFPAQLNYDLCTAAVKLLFSFVAHAITIMFISTPDQFFLERIR